MPELMKEPKHKFTFTVPDVTAYLYQPLLPLLKKINIHRRGERRLDPQDILLPDGYTAEVVATGFNAPVHCCFDEQGACYVVESGHKIEAGPRILKVDTATGKVETFYSIPKDQWDFTGAVTGACWYKGYLYVMNTDRLLRIDRTGNTEVILSDLAGKGDHQSNHPVIGPDGKIYFGQGTATNCGVVGPDDFGYEWLATYPRFCDVPAQDITLVGYNYKTHNILGNELESVYTGAYVPFATPNVPNQVIKGNVKCTGAVLRCNPDGSHLEVVAWGLRNPYSIAFSADGRLFATEHGMDERGARYVNNDPDDFYEIKKGEWYGWPDFASGIRLDDAYWGTGGRGREPVLAHFPNPNPPKPFAMFQSHSAANGFDFCRNPDFGFEGDAFVARFGKLSPITTVTQAAYPAGFDVVRVDLKTGEVHNFAVNKRAGPGSKLLHGGFERPSHCQFGPDGALYVVDFGVIHIAPEIGGIRQQMESGTLWRIRRSQGPHGEEPAKPVEIPIYLLQAIAMVAGAVGIGVISAQLVKKLRHNGRH